MIITRLWRDCPDTSCIDACPVDCIYEHVGPLSNRFPNQLYIDPEECIDCQACEPVCPWEAPLRESEVPAVFEDDLALNALVLEQFVVPAHPDKVQPAPTTSPPTDANGHDARHARREIGASAP